MDDFTQVRLIGLGVVCVIFIVTVLLMPRILGVNPPRTFADERAEPLPAPPATTEVPSGEPAVKPAEGTRRSGELAKS